MTSATNSFLTSKNEKALRFDSFKAVCSAAHAELKKRGVAIKLSDLQESLAVGYGFENLASYKAADGRGAARVTNVFPKAGEGSFFAVLVDGCIGDLDGEMEHSFLDLRALTEAGLNPQGGSPSDARMTDFYGRNSGFEGFEQYFQPCPVELTPQDCSRMIVTSVFVDGACVSRYGSPFYGDPTSLVERIQENTFFGVYKFSQTEVNDGGDDRIGYTMFEVFVPNDLMGFFVVN